MHSMTILGALFFGTPKSFKYKCKYVSASACIILHNSYWKLILIKLTGCKYLPIKVKPDIRWSVH